MIIVLEGCDGSGKTVLARELVKRLDLGYVHNSVPEPANKPLDYWLHQLRPLRRSTLIDRLHWSENVYGDAFRGGSKLSALDRWQLEGWLMAHGAVIIKCQPPLDTVLRNVAAAPDKLHHTLDQAMIVWHGFAQPWMSDIPVLIYDYTRENVDQLIRRIPRLDFLPFTHEGIGSVLPAYVFVADRHGDGAASDPLVLRSASGDYLRRVLEDELGLYLREYHVLNGWRFLTNRGAVRPNPDLAAFNDAKFVALGRQAEAALRKLRIEHTSAPHPQFWKRFHFNDVKGYARLIEECITC